MRGMKNLRIGIFCFVIFILFCLSPLYSFGDNSTNISLNIYEVTVDAGNHAVYVIDGVKYKGEKTFLFSTLEFCENNMITNTNVKVVKQAQTYFFRPTKFGFNFCQICTNSSLVFVVNVFSLLTILSNTLFYLAKIFFLIFS